MKINVIFFLLPNILIEQNVPIVTTYTQKINKNLYQKRTSEFEHPKFALYLEFQSHYYIRKSNYFHFLF